MYWEAHKPQRVLAPETLVQHTPLDITLFGTGLKTQCEHFQHFRSDHSLTGLRKRIKEIVQNATTYICVE